MFDALIKKTKLYQELENRNRMLEKALEESNCILGYMFSEAHVLHKDSLMKSKYTYIAAKDLEKYKGFVSKKTMVGFPEMIYRVWAEKENR